MYIHLYIYILQEYGGFFGKIKKKKKAVMKKNYSRMQDGMKEAKPWALLVVGSK